MQRSYKSISCGLVGPNQATTCLDKAIAMCIPKESPEMTTSHRSMCAAPNSKPWSSGVRSTWSPNSSVKMRWSSTSSGPPSNSTGSSVISTSSRTTIAVRSVSNFLYGHFGPQPVLIPTRRLGPTEGPFRCKKYPSRSCTKPSASATKSGTVRLFPKNLAASFKPRSYKTEASGFKGTIAPPPPQWQFALQF